VRGSLTTCPYAPFIRHLRSAGDPVLVTSIDAIGQPRGTTRRYVKLTAGASLALVLLGAVIAVTLTCGRREAVEAGGSPSGLTTTLTIEPFRTPESAVIAWSQMSFAESLAAHLERMPGLDVRVASGTDAVRTAFVLRGDITIQDGRLVIVSRLYEQGEEPPIWTATFWRDRASNANLVDNLAADLAEALYGHLARRSVTTIKEER
jgi:TolB-like protein